MNVWIITTGSSDVQLKNKDRWNTLFSKARSESRSELRTSNQFSFSESEQSGKKLWRYPSRAMGIVYGQALAEHYNDLDFPLLNSFSGYLKKEQIELNRIIVLLTDQSDFVSDPNKNKPSHPYWQDTSTLKPILKHYLKIAFPKVDMDSERDFLVLKPKSGLAGLDDWNEVLNLVQQELIKLDIPEDATVYVSHQAGTPAISSAVQFSSLARFRTNVHFLVSNEYSQETRPIHPSNYLGAIQLQEAKALLKRHDYSGVKELIGSYLSTESVILLDAAIQWNFAKFDEFIGELLKHPDNNIIKEVQKRKTDENWWWMAYESAYLGVVRLEQGNTVEAMFHSFRSVEGLLRQWVDKFYFEEIKQTKHPRWKENERWNRNLRIYGEDLYLFLSIKKEIDREKNPDIWIFGNQAFKKRNDLFHQLKGLQDKKAVFESWRSPNEKQWRENADKKWKDRILKCLNFVSGETFEYLDKKDQKGEIASLMAKVHEELINAITNYKHTP